MIFFKKIPVNFAAISPRHPSLVKFYDVKDILLTFRKIKQNKIASGFGMAGLVTGLLCVIYIFIWVADEAGFDRFHERIDRIFVVNAYLEEGGVQTMSFSGCPPAVGPSLMEEYPEVENACRVVHPLGKKLLATGESKYLEKVIYSDNSFFDIFSFPFIYGGRGEAGIKDKIVVTKTIAEKYFGKINPVGKIIRFDDRLDMTITGVIKDIPDNSTITFDAIIPLEHLLYYYGNNYLTTWYNNGFATYGLLVNPDSYEKIASKIGRRIQQEIPESVNYLKTYMFKNDYLYEQNHIRNIRIFILIGLLVLLTTILSFINLSTARSLKQAKETGLRKTIGASRMSLVALVYKDIALITLMAFVLAILLAFAGLPLFNKVVGKVISLAELISLKPILSLTGIYLVTAFLAGSYPAFYLSSFSPLRILGSTYQTVKSRALFRNSLIIGMYTVSIILLTSTLVISRQTRFLQKMDLGYNKEQLLYVNLTGKLRVQATVLKEQLKQSPDVLSASIVSNIPVELGNSNEGWEWEGKEPAFNPLVYSWWTDEDMIQTFDAKMLSGSFLTNDQNGVVINKTFADMIGWESFPGKHLINSGFQVQILGVMNDIHFNSLSDKTKPMMIFLGGNGSPGNFLVIKINTDHVPATLDFIRKACKSIDPSIQAEYTFMNDRYHKLLASEINLRRLTGVFSVFAIVVLCLGLLGVVMFLAEQKTKEIGIRKCLGESVMSISWQFIKPYLISGSVALLIASPVTWLAADLWLRNYAYHIDLRVSTFIFSGLLTIGIAVLTILWQSWRVATRNPVDALRYE